MGKWFKQVTKVGLSAKVVDRQQVHRTIPKEDLLHLFEFSDEENAAMLPGFGQEYGLAMDQHLNGEIGNHLKQKFTLSSRGCTLDNGEFAKQTSTTGTKPGCTTVCGECAQELSLEIFKKNGRLFDGINGPYFLSLRISLSLDDVRSMQPQPCHPSAAEV
ncbi:hypothetical protein RJ641_023391 [Dillenia turbinata]|uniref:Uncharacterized protein n=1 Tax=Dillenia turbinata TaxID=194707 RepID=A0AAN8YVK6_9MAGN